MRRLAILLGTGLIAAMAYVAILAGLDDLPLQLWDESRLANNAIEMRTTGNLLVTSYNGEADLWNTKPPMQIWLSALSMTAFGPSEWSHRLPAAATALATVLVTAWFAARATGNPIAAAAAAAVLLSSSGFVGLHVARTGDYDSLLILTTTLLCLAVYQLVEATRSGRSPAFRWLALLAASLAAGMLAKGIAILLIAPGLLVYALVRGALPRLARNGAIWLALLAGLAVPLTYYGLRELAGPGYLAAVALNELGGRYFGDIGGETRPLNYYIAALRAYPPGEPGSAYPWSVLWPFAVVVGLVLERSRGVVLLAAIVVTMQITIISTSSTKLTWYVAPVYPLIALSIAVAADAALLSAAGLLPTAFAGRAVTVVVWAGLGILAALTFSEILAARGTYLQTADSAETMEPASFLRRLRLADGAVLHIVSDGYREAEETLGGYSPQEEFAAKRLRAMGVDARVVPSEGFLPVPGTFVAWCSRNVVHQPVVTGETIAGSDHCRLVSVKDQSK